ncbi:MAG: RraA family protein [Betaproteobacteria bacterium]|nr:RraA family protein [Betaproteobacteria bacterium]
MAIAFRILPSAPPPAAGLVAALSEQASSHLTDSQSRARAIQGAIRAMHRGGRLCGPALTVRTTPGDNLLVHKAIDLARPGDVIVVDAGGTLDCAIIGDLVTSYAKTRGVAGFVIDGAIRDSEEIAGRDLPVYARGVTPRGPSKEGPGEINTPVTVGGTVVHPGDIVVGDADGVVIVPVADAQAALAAARALKEKESVTLQKIASGTLDRAWIDAALEARGCEFVR